MQRDGFEVWDGCLTAEASAAARARILRVFARFDEQLKYRPDLRALCESDDEKMWQLSLR